MWRVRVHFLPMHLSKAYSLHLQSYTYFRCALPYSVAEKQFGPTQLSINIFTRYHCSQLMLLLNNLILSSKLFFDRISLKLNEI